MSNDAAWCEVHDWPSYQCPPECRDGIKPKVRESVSPPPAYDGPRPTANSILISPTGIAHRLGACTHLPDYAYLVPPRWGWVDDLSLWPRVGTHEIPATTGNAARVASRRCEECDENS